MGFSVWHVAGLVLVLAFYLRDSGIWVSSAKSGAAVGSMQDEFGDVSVAHDSPVLTLEQEAVGEPKLSRRKTHEAEDTTVSSPHFVHIKFCQS